ncbi:hypothetical protein AVEN_23127-1 [Araneus ventricosus]|uniref:Uncharacterized protein n=1 Tax=Araneus ventricosus TaxID=182803 RepID=A0A4Y2NTX7_ARAVE|nr:hypothetical protein AVEN_23127-1 [Araneus ventricosus]
MLNDRDHSVEPTRQMNGSDHSVEPTHQMNGQDHSVEPTHQLNDRATATSNFIVSYSVMRYVIAVLFLSAKYAIDSRTKIAWHVLRL